MTRVFLSQITIWFFALTLVADREISSDPLELRLSSLLYPLHAESIIIRRCDVEKLFREQVLKSSKAFRYDLIIWQQQQVIRKSNHLVREGSRAGSCHPHRWPSVLKSHREPRGIFARKKDHKLKLAHYFSLNWTYCMLPPFRHCRLDSPVSDHKALRDHRHRECLRPRDKCSALTAPCSRSVSNSL